MSLVFVTSNKHKFLEAKEIAAKLGVEIIHKSVEYREIQSDSLEEIVRLGALESLEKLGLPCFVEDAGLFVESLKGFPGPYSKFAFLTIGNEGILKLMAGVTNRRAEFRSAIGFCRPGDQPRVFVGVCPGRITMEPRGSGGFGFDPIFEPEGGGGKTFSEMSTEEKNSFSHRGRALTAFIKWFKGMEEGKIEG